MDQENVGQEWKIDKQWVSQPVAEPRVKVNVNVNVNVSYSLTL